MPITKHGPYWRERLINTDLKNENRHLKEQLDRQQQYLDKYIAFFQFVQQGRIYTGRYTYLPFDADLLIKNFINESEELLESDK